MQRVGELARGIGEFGRRERGDEAAGDGGETGFVAAVVWGAEEKDGVGGCVDGGGVGRVCLFCWRNVRGPVRSVCQSLMDL